MKTHYRFLLSILILVSMVGALFTSFSFASSQTESPYQVYLPVLMKNPHTDPPAYYGVSRYMNTIDPVKSYVYGCQAGSTDKQLAGKQDKIIILAYGQPWGQNGEYGVWYYSGTFASTAVIAESAKQFAYGYWVCTGSDTESTIELVIGTSNFAKYDKGKCTEGSWFCNTTVAYEHGKRWALMVKDVSNWVVKNGISGQVSIAGGNDIEFLWNTPAITKAWIQGYDAFDENRYKLYNFGSCDACPYVGSTWHPPANNWTMSDAYYVAWGAAPVWPIPEIYLTTGKNAKEWAYLSYWGTINNRSKIQFQGTLTQWQACLQRGGCVVYDQYGNVLYGSNNTPEEGWLQLINEINRWTSTAQSTIRWQTDIRWSP
ncbi:MAG: hypothetical protein CVU40_12570 [Chloroflexi bacterium HGW-Chloroflexi-2]|nr:MAG: hypothetical protein CVU40_12570 [Chloroflexi bacterium HGW-Chloroflexi-2]